MKNLFRLLINNGFFVLALLLAVTLYLAYGTTPTRQAGGVDTAAPVTEASTAEATGDAAAETNMAAATPEGQPAPAAAPADETAAATSAEQNESPMPDSAATPDQTASSESGNTDTSRPSTAATPAETATEPTTPEKSTRLAESEPVPVPAQSEQETPDNGTDKPASQSESNAKSTDETTTSAPPPEVEASSADTADDSTDRSTNTNASRQNEATQPAVSAPQQENAAAATDKKANGALQPGLLFDPAKLEPRAILSRFNSAGEALREARTATRAGNYQWAAAIYASLLHFYPRADLAGELGNLFWRIGDKAWAHRAWRYAAQLLIREGRIDTARRFAENIAGIDPALSREIKAHLPAEKSAQRTTPQN